MAVSDDIKKQHKKVRKKGFKAMVSYFWDYYKVPTAIVLMAAVFLFFLIRDMTSTLPYGFYAMMINSTLHPDGNDIADDFAQYAGIDTQSVDVIIDTSQSLSTGTYNTYDVSTQEKIMTITAAGDLDVMIADQSVFEQYARNSYMMDLRELMSEEELNKYDGYIYYIDGAILKAIEDGTYEESSSEDSSSSEEGSFDSDNSSDTSDSGSAEDSISDQDISYMLGISTPSTIVTEDNFVLPDPDAMEDPIPIGIVITDTAYMQSTQTYEGVVPIFGIIANSSHTDEAIKFLEYMYDYTQDAV